MPMVAVWLLGGLVLLLNSCGEYQKVLKSTDPDYKYEQSLRYFNDKQYVKELNEMKDGSRVVVVRPSFSETWAFFVRKFDVKRSTLEQWFKGEPGCDESIESLKYLV